MDEVLLLYEKGQDLAKVGKLDEAAAAYKAAFELVAGPDAVSRRTLLSNKLAILYWNAGKDELAKPWYAILGQPMPKRSPTTMPFKRALKTLQKTGRCVSLTPKLTKTLIEEIYGQDGDEEEVELVSFLQAFYTSEDNALSEQAVKDGFIHHDWRFGQETSDAPAEFAQLVGGSNQLLKQVGYAPGTQLPQHNSAPPDVLTVERRDGERLSFPVESLDDIAAAFNQELEKIGDERRFVALQTDGDWHAYYLFDKSTFKSLCMAKLPAIPYESIPGIDQKLWIT